MYTMSDTINIHEKHAPDMKCMYNPQKKIEMNL